MPTHEELLDDIRARAREAHRAGQCASVVELLHPYLKRRPRDGFMWFLFGNSLRLIGLNDEAEIVLQTALEVGPERRACVLNQWAQLHSAAGRFAEAERCYAEVCNDSEFAHLGFVWILRGANLAAATQLTAAEECHRHALTFHDDHVNRDEAYLNLGYVLRAQGRYHEATQAFQKSLAITPDYAEALEARDSLIAIDEAIAKGRELTD
jgi:tetratricopeptide (TPR) repeat protein